MAQPRKYKERVQTLAVEHEGVYACDYKKLKKNLSLPEVKLQLHYDADDALMAHHIVHNLQPAAIIGKACDSSLLNQGVIKCFPNSSQGEQ